MRTGRGLSTTAVIACGLALAAGSACVAGTTRPAPAAAPTVAVAGTTQPTARCSVTLTLDGANVAAIGRGSGGGVQVRSDPTGLHLGCAGRPPVDVALQDGALAVTADGPTVAIGAGATEQVGAYRIHVLRVDATGADVDLDPV